MPFSPEDVRRLARAQRLDVDDAEAAALARDLDRILGAFGALAAAHAQDEPAGATPAAALRPDEPSPAPADVRAAILAAAPRTSGDAVKVPRRRA